MNADERRFEFGLTLFRRGSGRRPTAGLCGSRVGAHRQPINIRAGGCADRNKPCGFLAAARAEAGQASTSVTGPVVIDRQLCHGFGHRAVNLEYHERAEGLERPATAQHTVKGGSPAGAAQRPCQKEPALAVS